jgi:four helix bundle protein
MGKIEKFEDIESWKEARKLVNMIYEVSEEGTFAKDFSLKDQIRRASVSIMSNVSEGFGRGTNRELVQFLVVVRASAFEVQSQLYVALDRKYIDSNKFEAIYNQATSVVSLIDGFIRYLRKPRVQERTSRAWNIELGTS